MTQQESTIANSDLWCTYLKKQWSFWLDPFGLLANSSTPDLIADGVAARISNLLTLVAFGPIAWLYQTSAIPDDEAGRRSKPTEHPGEIT